MKVSLSKVAVTAACFAIAPLMASPAYAGPSDDECAIWLCLPAAFVVPECRPAYLSMVKRVAKLKPPLPLFGQCTKGPDANQTNADFTHTTSRYEPCRAGYTRTFWREDDEIELIDGGDRRFDTNTRQCTNFETGDSYTVHRGQNRHYVTVTVDGVSYDTFSFAE